MIPLVDPFVLSPATNHSNKVKRIDHSGPGSYGNIRLKDAGESIDDHLYNQYVLTNEQFNNLQVSHVTAVWDRETNNMRFTVWDDIDTRLHLIARMFPHSVGLIESEHVESQKYKLMVNTFKQITSSLTNQNLSESQLELINNLIRSIKVNELWSNTLELEAARARYILLVLLLLLKEKVILLEILIYSK